MRLRVGPVRGWDPAASVTAAVTGPMPGWSRSLRAGLGLRSAVICLAFEAISWSAASARFESRTASARATLVASASSRVRHAATRAICPPAGECPAGVDTKPGHAQQGGQSVDRSGPFHADVIARSDADSRCPLL
jgi:hypothetical protein